MSHVDEGELTAYADGAYAPQDPAASRIAAHLAECANCRNRLAQAQALSARASDVLAVAAPMAVHMPPFDEIAGVSSARRRRFPAVPLTWAATVILALGIGWFGRASVTPATRIVQAPVEEAAPAEPARAESAPPQSEARMGAREFDAPTASQLSVDVAADEVAAAPPPPPPVVATAAEPEAKSVAGVGAVAGNSVQTFPMIPDLEVVSVKSVGDSVYVQQRLPDGVVVTVASRLESSREAAKARRAESAMADAASKQMQAAPTPSFRVYGPLTEDSLRALSLRVR